MSATPYPEKGPPSKAVDDDAASSTSDDATGMVTDISTGSQHLHRKLRGKEVQLFAIGGAIGTCKYSL